MKSLAHTGLGLAIGVAVTTGIVALSHPDGNVEIHARKTAISSDSPDRLASEGKAEPGGLESKPPSRFLGIAGEPLSPYKVDQMGLISWEGALQVKAVVHGSVAASIGLKPGDLIVEFD